MRYCSLTYLDIVFSFQVASHLHIQSNHTFSNFELQKGKPKHPHRKIHSQTIGLCMKVVLSKISLCSKILVERSCKVRKTFGSLLGHSNQFRFQYVPKKDWFTENMFSLYFGRLCYLLAGDLSFGRKSGLQHGRLDHIAKSFSTFWARLPWPPSIFQLLVIQMFVVLARILMKKMDMVRIDFQIYQEINHVPVVKLPSPWSLMIM